MANELRLPLIRMVEGSGGGGSVKTIETTGRANVPGVSRLGVGGATTWAPCRASRSAWARWPAWAPRSWPPRTTR